MTTQPLDRAHFDARTLMRDYPPRWNSARKRLVFEIAKNSGHPFEGEVVYAVWREESLPATVAAGPSFEVRQGTFEYAPPEPGTIVWHLNFADPHLFVAYGSPLLAQDELQVAEHPILGSLYEALDAAGKSPRTVDEQLRATPVTITGVQRRCAIDTVPNPLVGRPHGLYGNAFDRAHPEVIRSATRPLTPPSISDILAMAALPGGWGEYSEQEILRVLHTAFSGFTAARVESHGIHSGDWKTVIHTGFWGCGAFGGNRVLMTMLQSIAADLAGVEMVFWAFDDQGVDLVRKARSQYETLRASTTSVDKIVARLVERKFKWGISDGN